MAPSCLCLCCLLIPKLDKVHFPAAAGRACEAWPLPPLQSPLWHSGPPRPIMIWKSCATPHQQCPFFPPCAMENFFLTLASTSGGAPWSCYLDHLHTPSVSSLVLSTGPCVFLVGYFLCVFSSSLTRIEISRGQSLPVLTIKYSMICRVNGTYRVIRNSLLKKKCSNVGAK